MVNHFATLLANLSLLELGPVEQLYILQDQLDALLVTDTQNAINLDQFYTMEPDKVYNILINRTYSKLTLPPVLQRFHEILFPANTSDYYKLFLLFSYLRLIAATDKAEHVKLYDSRIAYDLNEIQSYFRLAGITGTLSSDPLYSILPSGKILNTETVNASSIKFIVQQVDNSGNLVIFSPTQLKYYKQGFSPSSNITGMLTSLEFGADPYTSKPVVVGDTGLSFNLTGPIGDTGTGTDFSTSSYKTWAFAVDTSLSFDFLTKMNELETRQNLVDAMLGFERDSCTLTYENMWRMHPNSAYRLAGLLLAYVERIEVVWPSKVT